MKNKPIEFLFLDEALVAVNKPAGLSVLPGRGRNTSVREILASDPRLVGKTPLPVHRLDADTSGVMLVALSSESQKNLAAQFRNRTVTKEYFALVRGSPLHESGSVDLSIGVDPRNPKRMIIRGEDAKNCRTKWIMGERFNGVSLLKVYPVTGRRHQIRVHLKAMGYPLAVDPLYGGESLLLSEFKRRYKLGKADEERPLLERLSLHARSIAFDHPITGEKRTITAELPKDFRITLTALQRWAK